MLLLSHCAEGHFVSYPAQVVTSSRFLGINTNIIEWNYQGHSTHLGNNICSSPESFEDIFMVNLTLGVIAEVHNAVSYWRGIQTMFHGCLEVTCAIVVLKQQSCTEMSI